MSAVYIVDAVRTPIGRFGGQYKHLEAHQLGAASIRALLRRLHLPAHAVDALILGQVLTAGVGMNAARQAALAAGLLVETPAYVVNQVCGSGMRAIINGAMEIITGSADVMICGGQESMSRARHTRLSREGIKSSDDWADSLYRDGLCDYFSKQAMGVTAEQVAEKYGISRLRQDAFALQSQQKTKKAISDGLFQSQLTQPCDFRPSELVDGDFLDEHPRSVTLAGLAELKTIFQSEGTVTAGNASGINDAAAALVLVSERGLKRYDLKPMARIVAWQQSGVAPDYMGIGPVSACTQLLKRIKGDMTQIDLIEINEAFAATTLAVSDMMNWDSAQINHCGGAIALGHPIGASGARVTVNLVHQLRAQQKTNGLATLCIGGGMGIALAIKRV